MRRQRLQSDNSTAQVLTYLLRKMYKYPFRRTPHNKTSATQIVHADASCHTRQIKSANDQRKPVLRNEPARILCHDRQRSTWAATATHSAALMQHCNCHCNCVNSPRSRIFSCARFCLDLVCDRQRMIIMVELPNEYNFVILLSFRRSIPSTSGRGARQCATFAATVGNAATATGYSI